jgi:hypothetical protein
MKRFASLVFLSPVFTIALVVATATSPLSAQSGDNSYYFVTYFSNNITAAPDATVRLINDGDTNGNLWAAFYVFDDKEALTECCACEITPDGLLSESIQKELTSNPLTGVVPTHGAVKIVSTSSSDPTSLTPTTGLRGWATHIQSKVDTSPYGSSPYYQTETAFNDANFSTGERSMLQLLCYYLGLLGSGQGTCSCTPEDQDF